MATITYLILFIAAVQIYANPNPPVRIFGDERLKGQIFENLDAYAESRNANHTAYRLPNTTRPVHYDIHWKVDIQNLKFSGNVTIHLTATQANVNEIVIHTNDLNLSPVELKLNDAVIPTTSTVDSTTHFLRVQLNSPNTLQYNAANAIIYSLSIKFDAPLRDDMQGLYKSWYRNDMGNQAVRYIASTQFQPTSAREAFPCYDEPSFKATFNINITRPRTYRSWSCTKRNFTEIYDANYETDVYTETPRMSTYLLALMVADYAVHSDPNVTDYEVIARQAAIDTNQGEYAFDVGHKLTDTMSKLTGIGYYSVSSNLKMTHASVPDFSAGAMENWGLITYREAYLMYDPDNTNDYSKQIIAYILSHEIAHMWFGNLVTNEFWDCLWLNEGFARYYQYFLTDLVEDYMGFETRFIPEQVHTALLSDSSNSPQPLTNPYVGNPQSVRNMFSTISYNKGASVIRMTEHLLGSEVHNRGLQNYLKERYLGIAVPNDLFQALQAVAQSSGAISAYGPSFSVVDYYRSWTEQAGHPVLYVTVNHHTGDMYIQQRRFNINSGHSSVNSHWIIPITFATASNPDFNNTKPSHIMSTAVTVINRGSIGDDWVVFNKQQTGFYRVYYDEYTWDLITIALRGPNRTLIHEYNRAQIINDVFQFARSGLMSYSRAFNIMSFLENETDYAPWAAALEGVNWLRNRLAGTVHLAQLEEVVRRWSTRVMSELGYEPIPNESFMRAYTRFRLAPLMCNINIAACRTAARNQLTALIDRNTPVAVNNRNWVYCNGLREGDSTTYDHLWNRYLNHNVYTEKILILEVLGCTSSSSKLNELLRYIVEDNYYIRKQDYSAAFNGALTGNEPNTQVVFDFIRNNLNAVRNAFGSLYSPLSSVAARLRSDAEIDSFVSWANSAEIRQQLGEEYNSVINSAQSTRDSLRWVSTVVNDMSDYFTNGDANIVSSTPSVTSSPPTSTVTASTLQEPSTPDIPDSAASSFVSIIAVTFAVLANLLV